MTCIVGIAEKGKVYIGGDTAGVDERLNQSVRKDIKVFTNNDFIFGFTSSYRMGQLLRYALVIPPHLPKVDTYKYLVTDFIDSVRECLKKGGYATENNGEESAGEFLIGYRGGLYVISEDYQVGSTCTQYDAVGCGAEIAIGSLHTSQTLRKTPKQRITLALKAASLHSAGVGGPFRIVTI
jgi:hypothetical protein